MQRLFGIPIGTLAAVLVVLLAVGLGALAVFAVRNRILVKMSVRNVTRRRGRTTLIVAGLMLGTAIISSALATGDTVSHTIRSTVATSLGNTDETVAPIGTDTSTVGMLGERATAAYFAENTARNLADRVTALRHVDGATPAIIEAVASQDVVSRQTEPRMTVFAADPARMAAFGHITASGGATVSLADLAPGAVYLNKPAADELSASTGDQVVLYAGARATPMRVKAVVSYDGTGTSESAALMGLPAAQQLLGQADRVKYLLVSNDGGALGGAKYTDEVKAAVNRLGAPVGLEAAPVKKDGIKAADQMGDSFVNLFTTFGTFSITAGILLIFLIFVMLAAERRGEMGVARAVGMQRRHLVQQFVYEGVLYDIGAAVVGSILGVGVAYGMVQVLTSAFGSSGLEIEHYVQVTSLVIGFALGMLITLVVVTFSAWRVSRLNIVAAIRSLVEPVSHKGRRRGMITGAIGVAFGVLLLASGASSKQATPFMLGVSIVLIGLVPIATALRVPERVVYTGAGIALVVWWALPFSVVRSLVPGLKMNFSAWVVSGLMIVLGAVWTIMYNADVVLAAVSGALRRVRSLAPVVKTSVAYPLRARFRTGTTLAMFTLVVFTLVVGAITTTSFTAAVNDIGEFGGGFDVRAAAAPANPVPDIRHAVATTPGLNASDFAVASEQSFLPVDATQVGTGRKAETYPVRGLDGAFLHNTTFGLAAMARGYTSAPQVWAALDKTPGLAVVDSLVVQRRDNWNFGNRPAFGITGFNLEDATFDPVRVQIREPQTGVVRTLTVIGVLKDTAPYALAGLLTSQRTLQPFGDLARPSVYYFKLAPGVDAKATASRLESAFLANGMQADAISKILHDTVASSVTMNRLVLGFIGLGLIVGVAALGVVTARAVVERRQQIGVLRAIGFRRRMVQASLIMESSFVSLTAIVVGTVLGLLVARNVIADSASQPSWSNLSFTVPWLEFGVIFGVVYLGALAATYAPARRASRIYPAEALRYQ